VAAIGVYGVLAFSVEQRRREIGLRMALAPGSKRSSAPWFVRRSRRRSASAGLLAAYGLTRTIESFLYDVSPTDPATAVAVAGVLLLVAGIAAFVPARRAATINPMVALRAQD
jgi:ABC-type antimicrobial peptide transport system permease subunit